MKKKLDTRFPAARIKKIMQADEDVGKIAMAVPVLVSKALELFLQDLCDRTYDITVQRGAKTVNSLHLKHCVHSYNVFDFLKEAVSKVPDYGHSDSAADVSKRRKVVASESKDCDEESKGNIASEICQTRSSGRGRGRGRGKGRGRGRATERELPRVEVESGPDIIPQPSPGIAMDDGSELKESPKEQKVDDGVSLDSRNFNLNAGFAIDQNFVKPASAAAAAALPEPAVSASTGPIPDVKSEEYPGISEMDRMVIDHVNLVQIGSRTEEDEEDYDEEG